MLNASLNPPREAKKRIRRVNSCCTAVSASRLTQQMPMKTEPTIWPSVLEEKLKLFRFGFIKKSNTPAKDYLTAPLDSGA